MNILVMGLESRTNYEGQTLPADLLAAMHAGSVNGVNNEGVGSQDTNTLILIHIFAGGKKAVGFSISRDDLVTYPQAYDGQTEGKIDGAYAYAYTQYVSQNYGKEATRTCTCTPTRRARRPRSPPCSRSPASTSTTSSR